MSAAPEDSPASYGSRLVQQTAASGAFKKKLSQLGKNPLVLDHIAPQATPYAVALIASRLKKQRLWVLCADSKQQDLVHSELSIWGLHPAYLPRLPTRVQGTLTDPDLSAERSSVLTQWAAHSTSKTAKAPASQTAAPALLILCKDSLQDPVPAPRQLIQNQTTLSVGSTLDPEQLIQQLDSADYERGPIVSQRGQYAKRGGIIDLFGWSAEEPLRIEFFDDQIESIRVIDIHNQTSIRKLDQIQLSLSPTDADTDSHQPLHSYHQKTDLVIDLSRPADPDFAEAPALPIDAWITESTAPGSSIEDFSTAIHENPLGSFDASDFVLHEARRIHFLRQLDDWNQQGYTTHLFFHNDAERERFDELIAQQNSPALGKLQRTLGVLYRGFVIPAAKQAVITGAELFGRHQALRRIRGSKLDDPEALRKARDHLRELNERDPVVHIEHGIGRYRGVQSRTAGGKTEEVLVIEYADDAKLFVPIAQAHLVSRYVGTGGKNPPLSKLGDARWQRTRRRAEQSIEEYASQMLSIAADRQNLQGHPHPPDTKWQQEFEESFLYRETPDQLRCVEEIKADMEAPKPMDRLLCADVGFGKTEVAVRAAFKAVMGGKQVAILVPTTVLARQHFHTIRERVSEFPVTVEMLCRLTPADKEKDILRGIQHGSVDIVVGTHRLISKDVRYKDLGLVVIDEEQRFGVKHKERFKQLYRLIDVLTLSATPIPRTLYFGLMGMRDMSTIDTPPPNKQAVQTLVCPYDERVIRSAIDAELDRGGQVFFLHNRVQSIEHIAARIRHLCPRAKVIVGHGQMAEGLLEQVMHEFVEGGADVLVATTIIESGVDIPNANTILIDRADRFGLADLYQLRGRVGRGGSQAYAYLMLPRDFVDGGDARKRVNAIKQYTGLGSGFKIALRDLEIRGAGNLLGTEQSGHIAAIGFSLYCQMLKQAVNKLQGRRTARPIDVALRTDFLVTSEALMQEAPQRATAAYLPIDFIEDTALRIQAYRALGEITSKKELKELQSQWQDQFGERLPHPVQNLLTCAELRLAASKAGITEIEIKERKLMLQRNGRYLMTEGKFPRLQSKPGHHQLTEALTLIRSL